VPDCGDYVGIILIPWERYSGEGPIQPIIIKIRFGAEETAWGAEWNETDDVYQYDFPGDNWALYLIYDE
jgi:hypothetical protein